MHYVFQIVATFLAALGVSKLYSIHFGDKNSLLVGLIVISIFWFFFAIKEEIIEAIKTKQV